MQIVKKSHMLITRITYRVSMPEADMPCYISQIDRHIGFDWTVLDAAVRAQNELESWTLVYRGEAYPDGYSSDVMYHDFTYERSEDVTG